MGSPFTSSQTKWSDLFPTRWAPLIFFLYMALFINQGILVTASQSENHQGYTYNTVMAVLLTEFIKLIISSGLFIQRNSMSIFVSEIRQNGKVFFYYFIPAGLYCLYNNLAYVNLITFDPTTYFLLLQFRVVVTGIVFQILFKKKLSKHQWISLIFLTVGCMVKEINFSGLFGVEDAEEPLAHGKPANVAAATGKNSSVDSTKAKFVLFENPVGVVLILLQVFCSSGAGVYNEYLLKSPVTKEQKQTPILIQNVCLYIDSIICNIALLAFQGNLGAVMEYETLGVILYTPTVLAVVINNAAIGIVTSFFLAQLNSILKTFASALELMFTAVLCWMIFGIPIHLNTVIAIGIVTWAILYYSKEPVVNTANTNVVASSSNYNANANSSRRRTSSNVEDMQKILDEEIDV